uniref:dsDNA nuclease domain-containing protein n=1 Tax=Roseivirga sp. TaxID=1964215 RepID=UPI0040477384
MIKSIHDLVPLDLSGRPARRGFEYQDHVGAGYCLEMILNSAIKQIWFETEDDLTIIWDKSNKTIVEFVQVKNVNLQSRWSPSTICNKGEKGSSKCIVETSLAQDRCEEDTLFRIVSSYDVNDDLAVLKNPLGGKFRQDEIEKEDALIKSIKKKLGEVVSPKGNGIDYWVKNCLWEKLADTPQALEALNIKEKLSLCLKAMGLSLFQDQIKELYQRLLGFIVKASNSDIKLNP